MNVCLSFTPCDAQSLYQMVREDIARNYFICYSIDGGMHYEQVWQIDSSVGVFLRKSGLIQIAVKNGVNIDAYARPLHELLSNVAWRQAIVSEPVMHVLNQMGDGIKVEKGAIISELKPIDYRPMNITHSAFNFKPLREEHLDDVVTLYEGVFKSFAKKAYMSKKLEDGRGRGVALFVNDALVSVAQSDYESNDSALIVGVATEATHHGMGYGRAVMEALCSALVADGKTLYLQYDSPIAGKLYESLGFKQIEQNYYVSKMTE